MCWREISHRIVASNVVITGATGFIGTAVLRELLQRGIPTTVLLRPESNLERIASLSGFERLTCARLDEPSLVEKLRARQPNIFIHCAWRGVLGGARNEAFQITENIPLTIKSVELAHASGCRQWIGLGSQAEYGNANRRLDESAPTLPTTAYGRGKLAAGIAALGLAESLGLRGAWLRIFSTYGPGDAPQWLIQHVIREFLADRTPQLTRCEQLWDYLYVADAARAIVSVANGETAGVFNLGSGRAIVLMHPVARMESRHSPIESFMAALKESLFDIARSLSAVGNGCATRLDSPLSACPSVCRSRSRTCRASRCRRRCLLGNSSADRRRLLLPAR